MFVAPTLRYHIDLIISLANQWRNFTEKWIRFVSLSYNVIYYTQCELNEETSLILYTQQSLQSLSKVHNGKSIFLSFADFARIGVVTPPPIPTGQQGFNDSCQHIRNIEQIIG